MEVRALPEAPAPRAREADPDVALVAAAREEPRLFLALYDRYFDRVLGYVRLRIRDDATCEDVTSTVFTTALAQLGSFRGDGSFAGWLFQIARNAVHDVHRRPKVETLPLAAASSEPTSRSSSSRANGCRNCTPWCVCSDRSSSICSRCAMERGDERLRLAIRAQLGEQMLVRRRHRPRPWRSFGWAAVASVAAIAAAIISLGWPGGSALPSAADAAIIRHALRAISLPANAIVHVKEVGVQDGTPVAAEWWQQTSPPHALRMIKGTAGRQVEAASSATASFVYDAAANTLVETPASSAPVLVDPIAGVRQQLARGRAQVAGTATIDAKALYKITLSTGVVGYFDTSDYRPMYLDNPQRDGSVVRTRVVAYDELPMTPDNAKLLSITAQHPDARVLANAGGVAVK